MILTFLKSSFLQEMASYLWALLIFLHVHYTHIKQEKISKKIEQACFKGTLFFFKTMNHDCSPVLTTFARNQKEKTLIVLQKYFKKLKSSNAKEERVTNSYLYVHGYKVADA